MKQKGLVQYMETSGLYVINQGCETISPRDEPSPIAFPRQLYHFSHCLVLSLFLSAHFPHSKGVKPPSLWLHCWLFAFQFVYPWNSALENFLEILHAPI